MLDAVMTAIEWDRRRRAADDSLSESKQRFETLTPRERQVMLLAAEGKMNKQIAGDLGISEVTVKIHRGVAMKKMGIGFFCVAACALVPLFSGGFLAEKGIFPPDDTNNSSPPPSQKPLTPPEEPNDTTPAPGPSPNDDPNGTTNPQPARQP